MGRFFRLALVVLGIILVLIAGIVVVLNTSERGRQAIEVLNPSEVSQQQAELQEQYAQVNSRLQQIESDNDKLRLLQQQIQSELELNRNNFQGLLDFQVSLRNTSDAQINLSKRINDLDTDFSDLRNLIEREPSQVAQTFAAITRLQYLTMWLDSSIKSLPHTKPPTKVYQAISAQAAALHEPLRQRVLNTLTADWQQYTDKFANSQVDSQLRRLNAELLNGIDAIGYSKLPAANADDAPAVVQDINDSDQSQNWWQDALDRLSRSVIIVDAEKISAEELIQSYSLVTLNHLNVIDLIQARLAWYSGDVTQWQTSIASIETRLEQLQDRRSLIENKRYEASLANSVQILESIAQFSPAQAHTETGLSNTLSELTDIWQELTASDAL